MKEIKLNLTNKAQPLYARSGDIFMAENGGGKDMPPNSQPTGPEKTGQTAGAGEAPKIPTEQVEEARKEWESRNNVRRARGEEIPVNELRSQEMAWRQGAKPDLTQEAKDFLGSIDKGGIPAFMTGNLSRILQENGISDEDILTKTTDELVSLLRGKSPVAATQNPSPGNSSIGNASGGGNQPTPETSAGASGAGVPPGGGGREPPPPPMGGPEEQPQESGDEQQGEKAQEERETLDSVLRSLRQKIIDHDQQRKGDVSEGVDLMNEVRALIGQFPVVEAAGIPHEILELASYFRETREELINRILFRAYQDPTETNSYQESMNLYAQSNLDTLLGYLSRQDPTRHEYFVGLRTAANLFHTMNATLTGGNMEEFLSIAERINYQHFGLMKDIRGVPEVMRLYEQKYNEYLARDKRISTEGYENLKREVEEALLLENESGLIKSEYENERVKDNPGQLEGWELQRALNVGRTFFNITFRAAEKIATGQVPRKEKDKGTEGHKRFASFPQESAVRIMNWMQWLTYRFDVASSRGGQEFLKRVKNKYAEFLVQKRRHLGINRLIEFGGVKTDEAEVGAMFGVSGIYSTWRLENMAFSQIKIQIDGRETTIREWLDGEYNPNDPEAERISRFTKIEQIQELATKLRKDYRYTKELGKNEQYQEKVKKLQGQLEFVNPIIDNTNVGLGILLKHSIFSEEVGYEARKRIWEKVAQDNLPLMIDYLTDIKTDIKYEWEKLGDIDKKLEELRLKKDKSREDNLEIAKLEKEREKLQEIKANAEKTGSIVKPLEKLKEEFAKDESGEKWTDEKWKEFRKKVLIRHERMIKERLGNVLQPATSEDEFNAEEEKLKTEIQKSGRQLAPHLADIVFPYVPFMNDVPFELLDYKGPGNEFYKRRTASDLGSYFKAEGAFIAIMGNPGGLGEEETLKQFDAIVKGIESPNGSLDAQERVFPMFDSWLEFIETKPGERQLLYKLGKHVMRKHTSIAQEYSGMEATSLTESQEGKIIDTSVRMGILDRELANDMKKKKGITFLGIFWETIRDYFWVPFVSGSFEFGKQTIKEK